MWHKENESKQAESETEKDQDEAISYKEFMNGIEGLESKPEKINSKFNVAVNTLKGIVGNDNEVQKLNRMIEKYSEAKSVDVYRHDDIMYEVYTFLGDETFGVSTGIDGVKSLLLNTDLEMLRGLE